MDCFWNYTAALHRNIRVNYVFMFYLLLLLMIFLVYLIIIMGNCGNHTQ